MGSSIIKYLPLYDAFFQNNTLPLEKFVSTEKEITTPLSQRPVDFSVQTETREWKDTANEIVILFKKTIIFPWGIYELGRYVIQRIIMMPLYPLQSRIVTFFANIIRPCFSKSNLDLLRCSHAFFLSHEQAILRDVVFEKNGVLYSGILIGKESTIKNGNWVIQATGNMEPVEVGALEEFADFYTIELGYNVLLINGPAIGKNGGHATPESMGDLQELGITYLETAIKAKKIVIAGRSLGGAAINHAIVKHQFKPDIKYLVIRQMTFDRASHIISVVVGTFLPKVVSDLVAKVVIWSGCEMDCIEASRKLQELNIKEVIVQSTNKTIEEGNLPKMEDFSCDGPIPAEASLGHGLIKENVVENKVFICLRHAEHLDPYTIRAARKEIRSL